MRRIGCRAYLQFDTIGGDMKQLIFGHVHFDRMSIPEDLRDLAIWPAVDESALQETQLESYRCRRDAVIMFVRESHLPMIEIERKSGLQRRAARCRCFLA